MQAWSQIIEKVQDKMLNFLYFYCKGIENCVLAFDVCEAVYIYIYIYLTL